MEFEEMLRLAIALEEQINTLAKEKYDTFLKTYADELTSYVIENHQELGINTI